MIDNTLAMTAQIPSGFGMSVSGAISGTVLPMTGATAVCTAPTYVERDRHVAGFAVIAKAFRPGSHAWSPPTC
jgi:hypothetical protein